MGSLVAIQGTDGRYQRSYEHVAFVANPLGAEPDLQGATWRQVTQASRSLARLDQASRLVPAISMLRQPALRREAQSTSALEGTFAPLEEVLAADEDGGDVQSAEMLEVLNYLRAADNAFAALAQDRNLSVRLLEEGHHHLVKGTDSETEDMGRVRRCQVAIGSRSGRVEDARFVPMPPGPDLESSLRSLMDWMNSKEVPRDPIVAAAMAHYQFETLHPFNDGNGRIGRLLIVLQLTIDGLLDTPLLTVSPWFEQHRDEYQDGLARVSATGDWDAWVQFFATGIEASAEDAVQRVDRLMAVRERYVDILRAESLQGVIRDIVDMLLETPIVTVPALARRTGKSQVAINSALKNLVAHDILSGPIGVYNRRFFAVDVLAAIVAPLGMVPTPDAPIAEAPPAAAQPSSATPTNEHTS